MVPGVCYRQPLPPGVHRHLPREGQDGGGQRVPVESDPHRVVPQQASVPVVSEGGLGEEGEPVAVFLPHHREEQVAAGPQEDERGPAGHLQLMPQPRVAVVHHRVADVVAEYSAAHVPKDLDGNGIVGYGVY